MFLFTFRSRVNPKSKRVKEFSQFGGAYVNCWISFKDYEAAEKLAKLLIRESGWIPELKTGDSLVQRKEVKKEEEQYYAEALKYGYSLVFHTWPKDAKDASKDYEWEESQRGRRKKTKGSGR